MRLEGRTANTRGVSRHLPVAQELEELDALAQPAAHHVGAAVISATGTRFFPAETGLVKGFERFEDFGVRQVGIVQGRNLPRYRRSGRRGRYRPALADRLPVELSAGIGRGGETWIVCGLISATSGWSPRWSPWFRRGGRIRCRGS